jgi:hypothetical protein
MSQAKKITKFQEGAKIPGSNLAFRLNGQMIEIPETELNDFYVEYRNTLGGKGKNEQDWNRDYTDFVKRVKDGQLIGQHYSLNTGGGETISATTGTAATNADRGYKDNGKPVKDGLFGGITGVKNEARRDSYLVGALGNWLSRKQDSNNKLAEEERLKQESLQKEKDATEKSRLERSWSDLDGRLDIGSSLYGRQIGLTPEQAKTFTYTKRWGLEDADQRKFEIDYLKGLRDYINNPDYDNKDFQSKFLEKHQLGFDKIKGALSNFKFDDPNFDVAGAFRSLGLEGQYSALNDRKIYDEMLKAKSASEAAQATPIPDGWFNETDGTKSLYKDNKPYTGLFEEDGLFYKDGVLGSGDFGGLSYNSGSLREGLLDGLMWRGGMKYTGIDPNAEKYDYTEAEDMDVFIDGKSMKARDYLQNIDWEKSDSDIFEQLKSVFGEKYSQTIGPADNPKFNNTILKEGDNNRTPYSKDGANIPDFNKIIDASEISDEFSNLWNNSERKDGEIKLKQALVMERLDDTNVFQQNKVRYRFFDSNGKSYTGKIIANPRNITEKIFVSDDGVFRVSLGTQRSEDSIKKDRSEIKQRLYTFKDNPAVTKPDTSYSSAGTAGKAIASISDFISSFLPSNSKGGTVIKLPKFQNGGVSQRTTSNYSFSPNQEYSASTTLFDEDYKMKGSDYAQLGALATDLAGLGLAFVPGANVASAATGAGGSLLNYGAETAKDGEWFSNLGGLGVNLALDAATLMPLMGGTAKTAKAYRLLKNAAPILTTAFAAYGLTTSLKALDKIMKGDEASFQDWRELASGLTAVVGGGTSLGSKAFGYKKTGTQTVDIKIKKGNDIEVKKMELSPNDVKQLSLLEGNTKKANYLKQLAQDKNFAKNPDDIVIEAKDASIKGAKFWNWQMPSSKGLEVTKERQVFGPGEGNWFQRYMGKYEALSNLNAGGRNKWVGGYGVKARDIKNVKPNENFLGTAAIKQSSMPSRYGLNYMNNHKKGMTLNEAAEAANMGPKNIPTLLGLPEPRKPIITPWNPKPNNGTSSNAVPAKSQDIPDVTPSITPGRMTGPNGRFVPASAVGPQPKPATGKVTNDKGKFVRGSDYGPKLLSPTSPLTSVNSPLKSNSDTPIVVINKIVQDASSKLKTAKPITSTPAKPIKGKAKNPGSEKGVKGRSSKANEINKTIQNNLKNKFNNSKQKPAIKRKYETGGLIVMAQQGLGFANIIKNIYDAKSNPITQVINNTAKTTFNTPENIFNTNTVRQNQTPKFNVQQAKDFKLTPVEKMSIKPDFGFGSQFKPSNFTLPSFKDSLKGGVTPINTSEGLRLTPGIKKSKVQSLKDGIFSNEIAGDPSINVKTSGGVKDALKTLMVDPVNVSEFGRAMFNRAVSNQMDTTVPVVLQNNQVENYNSVKGDFLTQNAANQSANRLRSNSKSNMTTDGALQTGAQLAAESKAGQVELQGALSNSNAIREQEQQLLGLTNEFASRRANTANNNMSALGAAEVARIGKENEKRLAKAKSFDNYWANVNMSAKQDQLQDRMIYNEIAKLNVGSGRFGNEFSEQDWRNKTFNEVETALTREMNSIPLDQMNTPESQAKLQEINRKSRELAMEKQRYMYSSLINNPYSSKVPLFKFRKGGSVNRNRVSEAKEIEAYRTNVRNQTQWVKDYNNFMTKKADRDSKASISANKSINEFIKMALNKSNK